MTYVYENPLDKGFIKINIPKRVWNKIYPNAALKWFEYHEYYVDDNSLIIQKFNYQYVNVLNLLMSPIMLLGHGLMNYKEIYNEHTKAFNQKKYGTFVSHTLWKSGWSEDLDYVIFQEKFKYMNP